jgi:murein DD-endopeptidase MepM/ murein hydrolase activator NlpD
MRKVLRLRLGLWIGVLLVLPGGARAKDGTLTVVVRGPGRVVSTPPGIDCPSRCSVTLPAQTPLELKATPGRGATFRGWQGACAREGSCAVTLAGADVVLAGFGELEPRPLVSVRNEPCPGCSLAEKAVRADLFVQPVTDGVEQARPRFAVEEETRAVLRRLVDEGAEMQAAAARVSAGEVCEGSRAAAAGAAKLRSSRDAAGAARPRRLVAALAAPRGRYGDVEDRDLLAVQHRHRQTLAARVHDAAEEARTTFAGLCSAGQRKVTIEGRVSAVEPGKRRVQLADGQTLVLARKTFRAPVHEGAKVTFEALRFTDGSDLVLEVSPWDPPVLAQAACLKLRLAPLQTFPYNAGALDPSIVLHDPAGYKSGNAYWLEEGMRLALEQVCKPHVSTGYRYFAQLDLAYERLSGNGSIPDSETLETGMSSSHTPAALPDSIDPNADATLTIKEFRATCTRHLEGVPPHQHMVQHCTEEVQTATSTFVMRVRPRGSFASATFNTTLFALEDVYSTTEFAPAKVASVSTSSPVSAANSPVFEARGYRVTNGNSSRPNFQSIALNQSFAVYHDDGAVLSFPRIKGTRGGKPFWYSVTLPALITDAVTLCGTQPHAFYRLPWAFGTVASVTQGNNSSFTHSPGTWNAFAFDLIMPNATPIYAARGGVVNEVVESNSVNDDPNDPNDPAGDPNFLQVDHDDGSSSYYLHMLHDGVLVAQDQRIRRGQQIAFVGNTGFSTDPHLHFQVGSDAASMLIRFDGCFTPPQGTTLVSTNSTP